jgi:hypothetical protein
MQHHSLKLRFRAAIVTALGEIAAIASPEFIAQHIDLLAMQIQSIADGADLAKINAHFTSITTNHQEKELLNTWAAIAIALCHHHDLSALPNYVSIFRLTNLDGQTPLASEPGDHNLDRIVDIADLETLVLAYAIALCCRDQFNPCNFISKCCEYLDCLAKHYDRSDMGESRTIVMARIDRLVSEQCQRLRLVQKLVNQGQSALVARSQLSDSPYLSHRRSNMGKDDLSFGLYCFLSTPDHWQLVNLRLAHFLQQLDSQHSEAIDSQKSVERDSPELDKSEPQLKINSRVGISALAAVYNGAIPELQHEKLTRSGIELGDRLLAYWSGVYEPELDQANFYPALTAADVLGRRQ